MGWLAVAAAPVVAWGCDGDATGAARAPARRAFEDPCDSFAPPPLVGHAGPAWIAGQAASSGAPMGIVVADVDADGNNDVVVSRGGADPKDPARPSEPGEEGVLEVLYGPFPRPDDLCAPPAGASAELAGEVVPARTWRSDAAAPQPYAKLAVGDLDADGCLDVAVGHFGAGLELFMADKQGGRCELPGRGRRLGVERDRPIGVSAVALADLNGDGRLDLAAARYDRADPALGSPQRIYWNHDGTLDDDHVWESLDVVIGALAVALLDADGDGATDVLFGARGAKSPDANRAEVCGQDVRLPATAYDAAPRLGWGVLYRGDGAIRPDLRGAVLPWPHAPTRLAEVPHVVDLASWPDAPGTRPRVLVSSSLHWCSNDVCRAAARPRVFRPSNTLGAAVADDALPPLPPGNWLPAAFAAHGADAHAPDLALGLACQSRQQLPGRLVVLEKKTDTYVAAALGDRDFVVRAIASGDLDVPGTSPGEELVLGEVSGGNAGKVGVVYRCSAP